MGFCRVMPSMAGWRAGGETGRALCKDLYIAFSIDGRCFHIKLGFAIINSHFHLQYAKETET
jgi:hypothetical protein